MMKYLKKLRRENSGLYWFIVVVTFLTGLWPVGIFLIVAGNLDDKKDDDNSHPYSGGNQTYDAFSTMEQEPPKSRKKPKNSRMMLRKGGGNLLIGLGAFFAVVFFISAVDDLLLWLPQYPLNALEDSYVDFLFMGLSIFAVMMGVSRNRKTDRYRNYLAMLQGRDTAELREIARTSSYSLRTVKSDMQDMISAGIFGGDAWLDYTTGYVILTQEGRRVMEQRKAAAKAERAKKQAGSRKSEDQEQLKNEEILEEIRRLDEEIQDDKISDKIHRIEKITRQIFEHEDDSPENNRKLRSFLDYYLPTTLKMLRKYRDLEKQEVQGENISTTMRRIEEMMDKVAVGFEKQLDNLYQNDMLDITSDIAAMEQMMVKDGLSDGGGLKFE